MNLYRWAESGQIIFNLVLRITHRRFWPKFIGHRYRWSHDLIVTLGHFYVFQNYTDQLRNRFKNMYTYASVLMCGFQNPIIASDEVAIWHNIFRWYVPTLQDRFLDTLSKFGWLNIIKALIYFSKT